MRYNPTTPLDTKYFPTPLAPLYVGENMMPIGNWTVILIDPFRFFDCNGSRQP